jgi:hypothetical protein
MTSTTTTIPNNTHKGRRPMPDNNNSNNNIFFNGRIRLSYFVFTILLMIMFAFRSIGISSSNNDYNYNSLLTNKSKTQQQQQQQQQKIITKPLLTEDDFQQHLSVGNVGPKIKYAKVNGLIQRNKGYDDRNIWDVIENQNCMMIRSNNGASTSKTGYRNNNNNTDAISLLSIDAPKETIRSYWLPEAVLLGVQKGGTTALYQYIDHHPDIARSGKELYFLDEKIDQMMIHNYYHDTKDAMGNAMIIDDDETRPERGGIPQRWARREYGKLMRTSIMNHPTGQVDAGKMILDMTPNYLFYSDRIPSRISCVLPWAKLMVILRDPIDRARSQYDMKVTMEKNKNRRGKRRNAYGRPIPTFQQYILNDLAALKETGVVQDWSVVDFDTYFESPLMEDAWRAYINSGLNAPIGMGLYALQLKPYLELPNEFLAIQSEKLRTETEETYGQVLDFLGLRRIKLGTFPKINSAGQKKTTIDKKTRKLLRDTFEPFNRKLGELLGDEWDDVW